LTCKIYQFPAFATEMQNTKHMLENQVNKLKILLTD